MKRKSNKKIAFLLKYIIFIGGCFCISLGSYLFYKQKIEKNIKETKKMIIISVKGAVQFEGDFQFQQYVTFREVLAQINLSSEADISDFPLHIKIYFNRKIYIPFKKNGKRISWTNINSLAQLEKLGFSKSLAKKLWKLRKAKQSVTERDIDNLDRVGEKTLKSILSKISLF